MKRKLIPRQKFSWKLRIGQVWFIDMMQCICTMHTHTHTHTHSLSLSLSLSLNVNCNVIQFNVCTLSLSLAPFSHSSVRSVCVQKVWTLATGSSSCILLFSIIDDLAWLLLHQRILQAPDSIPPAFLSFHLEYLFI